MNKVVTYPYCVGLADRVSKCKVVIQSHCWIYN